MKETRKQKIDRQRGHAADRVCDPIRAAIDSGELVITPVLIIGDSNGRTSDVRKEPNHGDPRQTGTPSGSDDDERTSWTITTEHWQSFEALVQSLWNCTLDAREEHDGDRSAILNRFRDDFASWQQNVLRSNWPDPQSPDGPSPRRGSDEPLPSYVGSPSPVASPWTFSAEDYSLEACKRTGFIGAEKVRNDLPLAKMLREAAALRSEVEHLTHGIQVVADAAARQIREAEEQIAQITETMQGLLVQSDGTVRPLVDRVRTLVALTRACSATECQGGDCDVARLDAFLTAEREVERFHADNVILSTENRTLAGVIERWREDVERAYAENAKVVELEREVERLQHGIRSGIGTVVEDAALPELVGTVVAHLRTALANEEENRKWWRGRWRAVTQEQAEAMKVLAPNMPESGLVDACKQVKQVAISEADNSEKLEAEVERLTQELKSRTTL